MSGFKTLVPSPHATYTEDSAPLEWFTFLVSASPRDLSSTSLHENLSFQDSVLNYFSFYFLHQDHGGIIYVKQNVSILRVWPDEFRQVYMVI